MARLRLRGWLGSAIALYTWASRGRPWCPPSLLRHVLRVREGKAADAAHASDWPTAAPLVRNSPRGWTPRSLTTTRLGGRRAVGVVPASASAAAGTTGRCGSDGWYVVVATRLPNTFLASAPAPACLPTMLPRASARPTRTSRFGRVFGAHPRGEFRTSGAAVGQIRTRAAQRPFRYETRRTV
jgi:hypothetical protein